MEYLVSKKTKDDLMEECCNEQCKINITKDDYHKIESKDLSCEPLKRIEVMLGVYHELKNEPELWRKVPMTDIIFIQDKYAFNQLGNDWLHLKIVHIDSYEQNENNNDTLSMAQLLCMRYEMSDSFKCDDLSTCAGYQRHYRNRTNDEAEASLYFRRQDENRKKEEIMNNKEIVFQQECDKIHSFLLQLRKSHILSQCSVYLCIPTCFVHYLFVDILLQFDDKVWSRTTGNGKGRQCQSKNRCNNNTCKRKVIFSKTTRD